MPPLVRWITPLRVMRTRSGGGNDAAVVDRESEEAERVADEKQPNILVIWGDDIGITNLSAYSDGLMGYRTPNIDRIADEGMRFTDSYGEQSCTAGRSSFITGQSVYRTGLSKVGMPGADVGLQAEDVTIAELLKPLGYATGQFGKNHLGDLNKFLPTVHGFDEFFGNLDHLNAEEDPESPNWPPEEDFPGFNARFRPRGVLHSWATDTDDDTVAERSGRVGRQRIEDTGPLSRIAYEDAAAFTEWAGGTLPTEAQWELAARAGLDGAAYTWGDEPEPAGARLANYWHGDFPWRPEPGDGTTAPVGSFEPNGFGLSDMAGNVWEWTADWYGGSEAASRDPSQPQFAIPRKVVKGGSFLCADSYCLRYRPAARRLQMIDTGMSAVGFRVVRRPDA